MCLRKKINHHKVLQYSSFCREIKRSHNRLTLQEIELYSYRNSSDEVNDPAWSIHFRPTTKEVLVLATTSSYTSVRLFAAHTTSSIAGTTRNSIEKSSEVIADVLTLPKNGLLVTAELGNNSIDYLKCALANILVHLKNMLSKGEKTLLNIGSHISSIIRYFYDNFVLIMLILFISVVGIITLLQTTTLIINLMQA